MGRMTLTLPRLGETMEEARVTDWLVAPGTAYKRGDVLLEVETDKTVVEVPALTDGTLIAQLVAPGDMVALDHPIAEVEVEGAQGDVVANAAPDAPTKAAPSVVVPVAIPRAAGTIPGTNPAASPAARAAARRLGADLAQISGTGRRGRIMAADVSAAGQNTGNSATVVFLHGLFDDARGWRDLPQRVRALGAATHTPDLPGHGTSPAVAVTLDGMADALAATLPDGPLILIGHSVGAAIAVRLARGLGARVRHLIAIAPAGIGARINADFTDGMTQARSPAALGRALALLDAGPISATALAQELDRLLPLRDGQRLIAEALASGGIQQIDITADLAALACPTTVIFGTADRILHWHDVANLPATTAVHLVRGAGHLPHLAAPGLVPQLLRTLATLEHGRMSA